MCNVARMSGGNPVAYVEVDRALLAKYLAVLKAHEDAGIPVTEHDRNLARNVQWRIDRFENMLQTHYLCNPGPGRVFYLDMFFIQYDSALNQIELHMPHLEAKLKAKSAESSKGEGAPAGA